MSERRGPGNPEGVPRSIEPHCTGDVCITCSDEAVQVRVVQLLDADLAVVDTGQSTEEVSVALVGGDGGAAARSESVHHPLVARSDDPLVVKEVHVTAYHVLWELVHVLFEQPGVLDPEVIR